MQNVKISKFFNPWSTFNLPDLVSHQSYSHFDDFLLLKHVQENFVGLKSGNQEVKIYNFGVLIGKIFLILI